MSVFLFILGACLGSFYLVMGKRLPVGKDIIKSRSKCDSCGHVLSFFDLIPILSYVFLLGKCRYCHKKIDILCPIIEIVMGGLFAFSYNYFGIGYEMYIFDIVSSLMIIIFISDFSYFIILDSPLVLSIILITICKICYFGVSSLPLALLSGLGLFASMYLIMLIGNFIFKRESLGGGDIKFSFIIGYVLGFRLGLVAIILSTFLALPYSFAALNIKKNNEVPYGPFLASSLFIVFLFLPKFIGLLEVLFG